MPWSMSRRAVDLVLSAQYGMLSVLETLMAQWCAAEALSELCCTQWLSWQLLALPSRFL